MKNLFKKIKEKGISLIAKASYLATALSLTIMTCPVSADEQGLISGDSDTIFKNFLNAILGFVTYLGVGLFVWGVVSFFLAMRNEDSEKKTSALHTLIAGLGIIGIRAILAAVGVSL